MKFETDRWYLHASTNQPSTAVYLYFLKVEIVTDGMSMAKDRFCASYCMTLWYISATFDHLSVCISGAMDVRDSQKLVCDFQNWMLGSQ